MLRLKKEHLIELLIIICGFVCNFLSISLYIESLSNFISEIGVQALPFLLLAKAFFLALMGLFNIGIAPRFRQNRIFGLLILFFGLLFSLLPVLHNNPVFLTIYYFFISSLFFTFLDASLVAFAGNQVNPVRAKTFLPILVTIVDLALVLGSYFSASFSQINSNAGYGLIPGILLVMVAVLVNLLPHQRDHSNMVPAKSPKSKTWQEIRQSLWYVIKAPLYRYLAIAATIFICILYFIEFKQNTFLMQNILPIELNALMGKIFLAENLIRMVLSLLFLKKILFRFGLMNTMSFFAFALLAAIGAAYLLNWNLAGVVLVYLTFFVLYYTLFQIPATQTLALLPEERKNGVSFVFNQLGMAAASLIAACFLLVFTFHLELEKSLNTIAITILSLLGVLAVLKIRDKYNDRIHENLNSSITDMQKNAIDLLAEKAQMEKGEYSLRTLLTSRHLDPEIRKETINSLSLIGNPASIADLIESLKNPDDKIKIVALTGISKLLGSTKNLKKYPVTKHRLLEVFKEFFISNSPLYLKQEIMETLKVFEIEEIIRFLENNLKNVDQMVVKYSLETLGAFPDRSIIAYLEPFLVSPNVYLKTSAMVGLWQFPDYRKKMIYHIGEVLKMTSVEGEECAVFLIDRLNLYWEKQLLLKFLAHANEKIRIYALITLIKLGENRYIDQLLAIIHHLAKTHSQENLELLLSKYRFLNNKTKDQIIKKINQAELGQVERFYKIFQNSRYVFNRELDALKIG